MSATLDYSKPRRLQRSDLAVPATSDKYFKKAAASDADAIFIELEDAVAPAEKTRARVLAVAAINDNNWGTKVVSARVNGLDTEWGYRDIVELAEQCPRLDMVLVPKVGSAAEIQFVDILLSGIERATRRTRQIGIQALIESAAGMVNAPAIACASPRLEALVFGVGDYMIDMQTSDVRMGGFNPDYPVLDDGSIDRGKSPYYADQWHYAQSRLVTICRANNVRPIDGPYTDFSDAEGFMAAARRAKAMGFEGKWAIHPSQIDLANRVFAPGPQQLVWAEKVVCAMEKAISEGRGATKIDNELFDIAHLKLARQLLQRAEFIRVTKDRSFEVVARSNQL